MIMFSIIQIQYMLGELAFSSHSLGRTSVLAGSLVGGPLQVTGGWMTALLPRSLQIQDWPHFDAQVQSVSWAEDLELGILPVPSGVIAATMSTWWHSLDFHFVGSWKGKTRTSFSLLHVRSRWISQMWFWHHKCQMVSSYWLNWQMSMIVQGEYVCKTSLKQQKLKSWKRRHRSVLQFPLWSWYWGSRLLSYFKYVKGLMYQGLEINPIFNPSSFTFPYFYRCC